MEKQIKIFDTTPVSYTHLDVYKRQVEINSMPFIDRQPLEWLDDIGTK